MARWRERREQPPTSLHLLSHKKKMLQRRLRASKGLAVTCKGKTVSGNIFHPLCPGDGGAGQPRERPMRVARGLGRGTAKGADAVAVMGKALCVCASLCQQIPSIRKSPGAALFLSYPWQGEKVLLEIPCNDSPRCFAFGCWSVCQWVARGAWAVRTRNVCSSWQKAVGWGGVGSQQSRETIQTIRCAGQGTHAAAGGRLLPRGTARHSGLAGCWHPWQAESPPRPHHEHLLPLSCARQKSCSPGWSCLQGSG